MLFLQIPNVDWNSMLVSDYHEVKCIMAERVIQKPLELHTPTKIVSQQNCCIPEDLKRLLFPPSRTWEMQIYWLLYLPFNLLGCLAHRPAEQCIIILCGHRLNQVLMMIRALFSDMVSLFKEINTVIGTSMALYASFLFLSVRKIRSSYIYKTVLNQGGKVLILFKD